MIKIRVTPRDVYSLVERLEARSRSKLFEAQPEVQKDMALAAKILMTLLVRQVVTEPIELE